jgi:hypothetical protein
MPAPNLLGRHLTEQIGDHQASCSIPPATPGISQHSPLGRLTPGKKKPKNWISKELRTTTQLRGQKCWKHTEEGARDKELFSAWTFSKQMSGKAGRLTVGRW